MTGTGNTAVRSLAGLIGLSLVWAAAGCADSSVDPNGRFTVAATLLDINGAPATGTLVRVFKVDRPRSLEDNVLANVDLESGLDPDDVFEGISDENGRVFIEKLGKDVNTEDGSRAAHLVMVYQRDGDSRASLAAASDWHVFTDEQPAWEVGELHLWDGGMADQVGDVITYSWASNPLPSDTERVPDLPYFLYSFNFGQELRWASRTGGTSVQVPRVAYANRTEAPEFFVTGFVRGPQGGPYQVRSSLKQLGVWESVVSTEDLVEDLYEALGTPFADSQARDGDAVSSHSFGPGTTEFFVDLGISATFQTVLVFNLVMENIGNASVRLAVSDDAETWQPLGAPVLGNFDSEEWLYVANTNGATARWVRVRVESQDSGASAPRFLSVGEVEVLGPEN